MTQNNLFTIGVFAVVFNDQREILLVHRRDMDLWNLPGGGLEVGESVEEGIKREVLEETGFKINIQDVLGVYSKKDKNDLVITIIGSIQSGKITLNDEADEIEFFNSDNLPKNLPAKHLDRIQDALKFNGKTILKLQNLPDHQAAVEK